MRLRNAYANANDTITLNSIQMQMSMHQVIVTAIVIMADDKICHDNDSGDDNLMHAHLHLNRKYCCIVCVSVRISQPHHYYHFAVVGPVGTKLTQVVL